MATDVTNARESDRRQKLLIDELNHRVKNTLATVQSLIHQSLREGRELKETETLLTGRLMALSAAHDVLTREQWEGAELADIVKTVMKPYADRRNITLSGPRARIAPNVAVVLSMALNELAVNAIKYGGLSAGSGKVRLSWSKTVDAVTLEWRESDGPAVAAPTQKGFGSRLLGRGLAGELGAPAEMIYAPEGLICRMRAPVDGAADPRLNNAKRPARPLH
jgi:two-component sensor histidine kinase